MSIKHKSKVPTSNVTERWQELAKSKTRVEEAVAAYLERYPRESRLDALRAVTQYHREFASNIGKK